MKVWLIMYNRMDDGQDLLAVCSTLEIANTIYKKADFDIKMNSVIQEMTMDQEIFGSYV